MGRRSKKILFIAHCLLNQNTVTAGKAKYPGMVPHLISLAREKDVGIEQMPCPEFELLGCREKMTLTEYEKINGFKKLCSKLATHVSNYISKFQAAGYKIYGIVGIARSPSCSASEVYVKENSARRKRVKGDGIFIQELRKLVEVPIVDFDFKDVAGSLKRVKSLIVN
jgi:predicted secreted protein